MGPSSASPEAILRTDLPRREDAGGRNSVGARHGNTFGFGAHVNNQANVGTQPDLIVGRSSSSAWLGPARYPPEPDFNCDFANTPHSRNYRELGITNPQIIKAVGRHYPDADGQIHCHLLQRWTAWRGFG
jgi:hypothetical protein